MSPATSPAFLLRKPDWVLVALARDGNDAAFGTIVVRYGPELLRYTRRMLRDERAEDAVQQTFVQALQALRSGTEVRELRAWLYRIARNVALTELGSTRRQHAELSDELEDSSRIDEVDSRECLRQALLAISALPERQRTALLRAAGGENVSAIAEALGVSAGAARQLLHRARVSVRAAANALLPPPVFWMWRRFADIADKVPTPAAVPAGLAPLVPKIAALMIGAAIAVAPATLLHRGHSGPQMSEAEAAAIATNGLLEASTVLGQQGILTVGRPDAAHSPFGWAAGPVAYAGPAPVPNRGTGSSGSGTTDPTATDPGATAASCTDPNDPSCGGSTDTTCTDPNDPSCGGSTDTTATDTTSTDTSTDTSSTDTTATDTTSTDTSTDTTSTDTTSTDTTSTDTTSTDATSTDATSTGP